MKKTKRRNVNKQRENKRRASGKGMAKKKYIVTGKERKLRKELLIQKRMKEEKLKRTSQR